MENEKINKSGFTTPAFYHIQVKGVIDKKYSGYLSDMKISTVHEPGCPSISSLVGHLSDQAALLGVINSLYDLHYPVISIKIMNQP